MNYIEIIKKSQYSFKRIEQEYTYNVKSKPEVATEGIMKKIGEGIRKAFEWLRQKFKQLIEWLMSFFKTKEKQVENLTKDIKDIPESEVVDKIDKVFNKPEKDNVPTSTQTTSSTKTSNNATSTTSTMTTTTVKSTPPRPQATKTEVKMEDLVNHKLYDVTGNQFDFNTIFKKGKLKTIGFYCCEVGYQALNELYWLERTRIESNKDYTENQIRAVFKDQYENSVVDKIDIETTHLILGDKEYRFELQNELFETAKLVHHGYNKDIPNKSVSLGKSDVTKWLESCRKSLDEYSKFLTLCQRKADDKQQAIQKHLEFLEKHEPLKLDSKITSGLTNIVKHNHQTGMAVMHKVGAILNKQIQTLEKIIH